MLLRSRDAQRHFQWSTVVDAVSTCTDAFPVLEVAPEAETVEVALRDGEEVSAGSTIVMVMVTLT